MKRVALITTNRILGQSLAVAMENMEDLEWDFFLFLNSQQALLDAEILEIDLALIDVTDSGRGEKDTTLTFCEELHKNLPNCHLLLLVSQDDMVSRKMATKAKQDNIVDDFVFYDASLKYLFAKLAAL